MHILLLHWETGCLALQPVSFYQCLGRGGEGPLRKKTRSLHGNDLEERDFP